MRNLFIIILLSLISQCFFGCATKNARIELVQERAVFDLDCTSINVVALGNNVFGVTGCGKRNTYIVDCKDINIGACTAIMNSNVKKE